MNEIGGLREKLITWYDSNRRILPWREDPTPFHVWLSEIMLQQTRVEAVREYYERFLARIPDIASLAAADEQIVLKLWEGLGYYSRARNLRKCAQVVMAEYGGQMPGQAAELKKLPGIGDYTSAAVASIAFGNEAIAVDGNLLRIFARMTSYPEQIKTPEAKTAAERYFLEILRGGQQGKTGNRDMKPNIVGKVPLTAGETAENGNGESSRNLPGDFNQALMDLGATVCLPNAQPRCGECPWQDECRAHMEGQETAYPVPSPKKERRIEQKTVLLILSGEKIILHKRPGTGLLAGLYEFPMLEGFADEEEVLRAVKAMGFDAIRIRKAPDGKHIFTHKEWHMKGYAVYADEKTDITGTALTAGQTETDSMDGSQRDSGPYIAADLSQILATYPIPEAFRVYKKFILKI